MSRTKKLGVRRIAGWKQTVAREARELPAMHDERDRLDGGGFEVRGFLNFEPRTSNRAFLASLASLARLSGAPTELFRLVVI